jgi:hypothetical protein
MAKTIEIINHLELLGFLKTNGTGCRFVGITYKTEMEGGKNIRKGHPFGRLFKVSKFQGLINADYVESVKSRIAAATGYEKSEVTYKSGPSAYIHLMTGEGKALPVLVKAASPDDGVYYLQYFPTVEKTESVYVNEGGDVIPKDEVKPWLYAKGSGSPFKPAVTSLKLANIVELRASGLILTTDEMEEAKSALAQA